MDFPTEVDVIVIGTGVTETIVSGAFSRAGKTVLHLDENNYYGSDWASFNLSSFLDFVSENESIRENKDIDKIEMLSFIPDEEENGLPPSDPLEETTVWTWKKLKLLSNKISIDISPRFVFSKGPMVDLLVNSNICRYLEFKNCTRLLVINPTDDGYKTMAVPCSRESIFNDSSLSLIQKRKMMKFIDYCMGLKNKPEELDKVKQVSFKDFLEGQGFDERLKSVINCVSIQEVVSVDDFLKNMTHFTQSVGRFGPTPFLWPLYGAGELPQAFSRLSAVFGGTFCLGQEIKKVSQLEDDFIEVKFNDKSVKCKILVGNQSSLPQDILSLDSSVQEKCYSLAICLTNQSIQGIDQNQVTFGRIPWSDDCNITLIEVGSGTLCVPKGLFLVYLSCMSSQVDGVKMTAKQKLMPVVEKLFSKPTEPDKAVEYKPQVLWCSFLDRSAPGKMISRLPGVSVVFNPLHEQDYESCIFEGKEIFHKYFPSEEFLPRAPDAEDIIMEDDPEADGNE